MNKPNLLFVYDLENEDLWQDGLWAALNLLEKDFNLYKENLQVQHSMIVEDGWDFILGWGGFNSSVDQELRKPIYKHSKKGLCIGGYGFAPRPDINYDILFYECEWARKWMRPYLPDGIVAKHAFGVNTDIYKPDPTAPKIWDYLTVGAFSNWKRQEKILEKKGSKMAIGQIQRDNLSESVDIIGNLLLGGCGVSDMLEPIKLAKMYTTASICYIPATEYGGGERAVMEARACGLEVEVEPDNKKLQEVATMPIYSHHDYAKRLREGIQLCLS